ncbi:Rnh70p, partial [Ascoidea rubescens DSM 1968]
KKLTVPDLRDLILYVFHDYSTNKLSWINITNRSKIRNLVFLFVPGLSADLFTNLSDFTKTFQPQKIIGNCSIDNHLDFFSDKFDCIFPTVAPGNRESLYSSFASLTNVPLTKKEKKTLKTSSGPKRKITLFNLLMTHNLLVSQNYPIHSKLDRGESCTGNWVETIDFEHPGCKTFAMDCEMCESENGKVLTRISLIDYNYNIVFDSYVKPSEPITNYLTEYSGITEEILENVTVTLKDVQAKLLSIVSSSDFLIGHSLESDLNVLFIKHPLIIDTSVIYEHPKGPPSKPSLKWLALKYLNSKIQIGNKGHSSIEDAKTCMSLTRLKLQNGINFGINIGDQQTIFKRLNSQTKIGKTLILDYTSNYKFQHPSCNDEVIPTVTENEFEKRIQCFNDDEITQNIVDNASKYRFILGKLRELEFGLNWVEKPKTFKPSSNTDTNDFNTNTDDEHAESGKDNSEDRIHETHCKRLNARLKKIHQSLPSSSMLIICSGSGDTRDMIQLQNQKRDF